MFSGASWQRCRTHIMANLASRVPKVSWPMIATLVRSIFEQPDRDAAWDQLGEAVDRLTQAGFNDIAVVLLDAADDILAFSAFPAEHWPKIRSNSPQERLNKEIRRRTDVVGIFPNRAAVIRLVGALLAEQTDEWAVTKRYMSAETLKTPRSDQPSDHDPRLEPPGLASTAGSDSSVASWNGACRRTRPSSSCPAARTRPTRKESPFRTVMSHGTMTVEAFAPHSLCPKGSASKSLVQSALRQTRGALPPARTPRSGRTWTSTSPRR